MDTGAVRWFDPDKGCGLIARDDGGPDLLVRIGAIEESGMSELYDGQKLAFKITPDPLNGKDVATDLKAVE